MTLEYSQQLSEIDRLIGSISDSKQGLTVVVTGSREWNDRKTILEAVITLARSGMVTEAIHGGARGADLAFAGFCRRLEIPKVTAVPAKWDTHDDNCPDWHHELETCKMAGRRRNAEMADMKPDLCLAFSVNDSPGTSNMISECRRRDIPVVLFSE